MKRYDFYNEEICEMPTEQLAKEIKDADFYEWDKIRELVYRAYVWTDDEDFEARAKAWDDETEIGDAWDLAEEAASILGVIIDE